MDPTLGTLLAVGIGWALGGLTGIIGFVGTRCIERRRAEHRALACMLAFRRFVLRLTSTQDGRWDAAWKAVIEKSIGNLSAKTQSQLAETVDRGDVFALVRVAAEAARVVPQYRESILEVASIDPVLADRLMNHAARLELLGEHWKALDQEAEECASGSPLPSASSVRMGALFGLRKGLARQSKDLDDAIRLIGRRSRWSVRRELRKVLEAKEPDDAAVRAEAEALFEWAQGRSSGIATVVQSKRSDGA
ncbi:MAG: hypothetical protein JXB32_18050 [Deltaproteobacteria bacterium]|nr:hypothetical protein [Deltaproteobacteria bacterium]